jgi:type IV secretion system protein VirD4
MFLALIRKEGAFMAYSLPDPGCAPAVAGGCFTRISGVVRRLAFRMAQKQWQQFGRIAAWIMLALVVYILDVWVVGSISAAAAALQSSQAWSMHGMPNFTWERLFFFNPFRAAGLIITGVLPAGVMIAWLKGNLVAIPFSLFLYIMSSKRSGHDGLLKFSSDPSRGTAGWMDRRHINSVLRTGYGPGIIFGKDIATGKVLRMPPPNETKYNSHVVVFGSSGSMKSRAYITNAILQSALMGASVIVTDSKGMLYNKCAAYLESEGYTVKVLNTVNMLHSNRFNLLGEIRTDLDAQVLTEIIIANTVLPGGAKGKSDAFWVQGEMGLIKAIVLYCVTMLPRERRNMGSFYSMITTGKPAYLDGLFAKVKPDSPARLSYNIYLQSPGIVRDGIISGLANRLQIFQNDLVRAFTATSDIELSLPGNQKCAYFCIMPDYHSAYDYLSSLFFSFLFIRLIELADSTPEKTLPVPCLFLLDEFPNIAGINDFKKKLATIRSRNMHASIVFQDLSQLEDRYPNKGWTGIIGNCDSRLFLGANDPETAGFVESLLGKSTVLTRSCSRNAGPQGWLEWGRETIRPEARNLMNLDEVLRLPLDEAILLIRGQHPLRLKKMDYTQHPLAGRLVDRNINDYLPPWAREFEKTRQVDPTTDYSQTVIQQLPCPCGTESAPSSSPRQVRRAPRASLSTAGLTPGLKECRLHGSRRGFDATALAGERQLQPGAAEAPVPFFPKPIP